MTRLLRSAALLAIASTAAADEPAPSLLDAFLDMSIVRNAEISPPGTHVAWKDFRNDFEEDRQTEQLWVTAVDGGEPIQLTRGEQSVGDYEWSPDGRWLLFTRDGAVHVLRVAGGEAFELELEGAEGARNLRFAPNGRALYFLAGAEDDDWAEAREEAYGDYTVFREEGDYAHLWRQALDATCAVLSA